MSAESRTFKKVIRKRRKRELARKEGRADFRHFKAEVAHFKLFSKPKDHAVPDTSGD